MLFEKDTVLFYCAEAKGYVFSNPPWPVGSNSVVSKSHVTIQSCGFSTKRNPVGSTKVSVASEREHVASKRKFGATESDAYTRESDTEESAEREDGASKKESSTEQSGACTRKFDTKDSDLILPNCIQFGAFQILPEFDHASDDLSKAESTNIKPYRKLIYGRKVKLYHRASEMYVHISPPSEQNKNPVGMLCAECSEKNNIFRILSANDPGKDRGEHVEIEDKIILESLSMKGHHVFFARNSLTQRYEMKVGVAYSTFIIRAHITDRSPRAVKSGDVVLLFNLKHHAYVSCKGSFACDEPPLNSTLASNEFDVRVKSLKNRYRQGVQKPPPTSCNAFWQLEQFTCPLTGNQLKYNEDYCIKHLPTQQYLAVEKWDSNYTVRLRKLTSVTDKSDVCFHLVPIDKDSEECEKVMKDCYVELRHSKTKRLLSIEAKVVSKGQEDTWPNFCLRLVERDTTHDHLEIFKLELVNLKVVRELYSVIGCVSVFSDYMKKLMQEDRSSFMILLDEFKDTLKDIQCWLQDASQSITKSKAKLLHSTMLVDQLMGFMDLMTDTSRNDVMSLCKDINIVLVQYLKCSDKKLRSHLANKKFIGILLRKIGHNTQAENVLIELIKDDMQLAIKIMMVNLRDFQVLLTPETLELFSAMCFSVGKPLKGIIQGIILKRILGVRELYRTQLTDGEVKFTTDPAIPDHLKGKPLVGLNKEESRFYIAQVKLFSQLCKASNTNAMERIVEEERFITFQEAIAVFSTTDVNTEIKSAYFDFVQAAFADNALDEGGTDTDNIWRCYKWESVTKDPLAAVCEPKDPYMNTLQDIIAKRLRVLSESPSPLFSEFDTKLLSLLGSLVAYGFYGKGESSNGSFDIIRCLVQLLRNCDNDMCTLEAINVLRILFKELSYTAVGKFIYDFKRGYHLNRLEDHFRVDGYHCLDIFCENQKLIDTLIKLLNNQSDDVVFRSAQLLFDLHKREQILFNDAANSFLVTTYTSSKFFDECVTFATFEDANQILLKMHRDSLQDGQLKELLQHLERWTENCFLKDDSVEPIVCTAEPNMCLQGIAYSSRLFSHILNYVVVHCKICETDHDGGILQLEYGLKVIPQACLFLSACMKRNEMAQIYLFELYFMDLVEAKVCGYHIAQMLTEAITDNESLCQRISAPELQQIFRVATCFTEKVELCTTLQATMKVSKSSPAVMKIRQEAIVKLIQKSDKDIRLEILKSKSPDNEPKVMLLISLVDLLSVCCEDKCYSGKRFCCDFFSVDVLLQVLADEEVCLERKKPFARLLTEAYLHSDTETVCADLAKQPEFWAHVEYCAILLKGVCSSVPHDDRRIPVALKLLATTHLSLKGWADIAQKLNSTVDDGNDGVSLNSALFYLWEGAIPLVTAYCSAYCTLKHSGPSSKMYRRLLTAKHMSVLTTFDESLMAIESRVRVLVTTESQVGMFASCMEALHHVLNAEIDAFHQPIWLLDSLKDETSTVMKKYHSKFKEEEDLNKKFQKHVTKCRKMHEVQSSSGKEILDAVDLEILDAVRAPRIIPSDSSFKKLVEKFTSKVKFLKKLLSIQSRETKTTRERKELDDILFTCLQLLVSINSAFLPKCGRLLQDIEEAPVAYEKKNLEEMQKKQKDMLAMEVHNEVLLHLSHSKGDHVVLSMAFLSTLLFGNKKCQTELQRFWVEHDNVLFLKMHSILVQTSSTLFGGRLHMNQFREIPVYKLRESDDEWASPSTSSISIIMDYPDGNTNDVVMKTSLIETDGQFCEQDQLVKGVIAKEDEVQVFILLDLLSWMCDGQNKTMQDLLRKQDTGLSSLNIVGQVATLLVDITDHLDKDTLKIAERALQALIETCAGNYGNQESAFEAQVVDALNQIFAYDCSNFFIEKVVVQTLKYSALELLEVLLEETDVRSDNLGRMISEDIHVLSVVKCMKYLWHMHIQEENPAFKIPQPVTIQQLATIKDKARQALYRGYHNLLKMSYYLNVPIQSLVPKYVYETPEYLKIWEYVAEWSHSVEVEYTTTNGSSILTTAYFPFNPKDELTDANKDTIEAKINRESQEDKVKDLLKWCKYIKEDKEHKEKVKSNNFLKWVDFGSNIRFYILALLTLLMNLFIVILFEAPTSEPDSNDNITISLPITPSWYNYVFFILGLIHLALASWLVLEYFVTKQPHIKFYRMEKALAQIKKCWKKNFPQSKVESSKNHNPSKYQLRGYQVDLLSFKPIYTIFFLLCSMLSLGFQGYFYCFCLFYIFLRFSTLTTVLNAVSRSGKQLILVFGVIFVIIFIYSVLSFAFLHNFFKKEDGQFCDNLGQCFVSVLRGGLLDTLSSDVISLTTSDMAEPSFTVVALRMLFDISFFIIVTALGLNIVIAILVDHFTELRQERDKITDDQQKQCFICGISSDSFDRQGQGFSKHIIDDHNKWNYIYYILYLETIHENDRNALEKEVFEKVYKQSIEFFPLHKAKVLPKMDADN